MALLDGGNARKILGVAVLIAGMGITVYWLRPVAAPVPTVSITGPSEQVATPPVNAPAEMAAPATVVAETVDDSAAIALETPQPSITEPVDTETATLDAQPQIKEIAADAQSEAAAPVEAATNTEAGVAETVPAEPEIEKTTPIPPVVTTVRIDPVGNALLAGKAGPGALVQVMLGAEVLAEVRASMGGDFAALFDFAPSETARSLRVRVQMGDGTVVDAQDTILVAAAKAPKAVADANDTAVVSPSAPVRTAALAPEPKTETVSEPAPEAAPSTAPTVLRTQGDTVEIVQGTPELVTSVGIDTITYDEVGNVVLNGRGEGERVVRVYLDDEPVSTVDVGAEGTWRADLPDVETGIYTLRIDALDADGTVVSRLETPFERAPAEVAASIARSGDVFVTVQPGFTLWGIAETQYGNGLRYVQVFEANRALIRDPDLIYPGQVFEVPSGTTQN